MKHLEVIRLDENNIGDVGAAALAWAFWKMDKVKRLVLDENVIGDEGLKALAAAFKTMASLEDVGLASNLFRAEGAVALAKALPVMKSLKSVDFSGGKNVVGDEGFEALARAVPHTPKLHKLAVSPSRASDESIELLKNALSWEVFEEIEDVEEGTLMWWTDGM